MKKKKSDLCAIILARWPRRLRERFKAKCYSKGLTMRQVILEFMKKETQK